MARGEDGDDARPVVGLELLGGVDEDEAQGSLRVDAGQQSGDVQDVGGVGGAGVGAVWGNVETGVEEGFNVAHAEEGGCGWGKQDDGIGAAAGLFGEIDEGGIGDGSGSGGRLVVWTVTVAAEEDFCGFADLGKVLGPPMSVNNSRRDG